MENDQKHVDDMHHGEQLKYWQDLVSRPGALSDYRVARVDGKLGDRQIKLLLEQVGTDARDGAEDSN